MDSPHSSTASSSDDSPAAVSRSPSSGSNAGADSSMMVDYACEYIASGGQVRKKETGKGDSTTGMSGSTNLGSSLPRVRPVSPRTEAKIRHRILRRMFLEEELQKAVDQFNASKTTSYAQRNKDRVEELEGQFREMVKKAPFQSCSTLPWRAREPNQSLSLWQRHNHYTIANPPPPIGKRFPDFSGIVHVIDMEDVVPLQYMEACEGKECPPMDDNTFESAMMVFNFWGAAPTPEHMPVWKFSPKSTLADDCDNCGHEIKGTYFQNVMVPAATRLCKRCMMMLFRTCHHFLISAVPGEITAEMLNDPPPVDIDMATRSAAWRINRQRKEGRDRDPLKRRESLSAMYSANAQDPDDMYRRKNLSARKTTEKDDDDDDDFDDDGDD